MTNIAQSYRQAELSRIAEEYPVACRGVFSKNCFGVHRCDFRETDCFC